MHGLGKFSYPDASVYKGEFVNGLKNGKGILEFASGEVE